MISVERRKRILEKISNVEDDSLLQAIESLLNQESEEIDHLTPDEEAKVLRGYQQYKDGNSKTSEEIEQKFDEWLEK
jgi:hypothetical protein